MTDYEALSKYLDNETIEELKKEPHDGSINPELAKKLLDVIDEKIREREFELMSINLILDVAENMEADGSLNLEGKIDLKELRDMVKTLTESLEEIKTERDGLELLAFFFTIKKSFEKYADEDKK